MEQLEISENIQVRRSKYDCSYWRRRKQVKTICIVLLILSAVIAILLAALHFWQPITVKKTKTYKAFTLEQAYSDEFYPIAHNGTFGENGTWIFVNQDGDLMKLDPYTNVEYLLMSHTVFNFNEAITWSMSGDNKFALYKTEDTDDLAYTREYYQVVDTQRNTILVLSNSRRLEEIQMAVWGPQGSSIAFVEQNTLYYKESINSKATKIYGLVGDRISVGKPDWVYEEEIFSNKPAIWFSENGEFLAFAVFNDSNVHQVQLAHYEQPDNIKYQYTSDRILSYPKPGTSNPVAVIFYRAVFGPHRKILYTVTLPQLLHSDNHVLTSVAWASSTNLVITWMNRVQNQSIIQTCELGQCHIIKTNSVENGWFDANQHSIFSSDGYSLAMIQSSEQLFGKMNDSFSQITILSLLDGNEFEIINDSLNVQKILRWDEKTSHIFFLGNYEWDSQKTHLFAASLIPEKTIPQCISWNITTDGILQTVFDADFDPAGKHFVLHILGPSIPRVELYSYGLDEKLGRIAIKYMRTLQMNDHIHTNISDIEEPIIKYFDLPINNLDGWTARVKIMVSKEIDNSRDNKTYPLIVQVYGGPNSYIGSDEWSVGFLSYLASNKSYVVAIIDARGSGRRGDRYKFAGYRRLGTVEVTDQIEIVKTLCDKIKYLDANNVGIFGWSYGGYVAAMALAQDTENVFKCAAALVPVTNWFYYDSIYTERYMGMPSDNVAGYEESNLLYQVENLRNKSLYLVHGTFDDNVLVQHTMALSMELARNNVPFKQMIYPDEKHGLHGVSPHVYGGLNRFFDECFNLK